MKKRLFIALNATDPLAESFLPTFKKLKTNADKKDLDMKWTFPGNYHVTVSFLGDRNELDIPQIAKILDHVCQQFRPFEVKIEDIGAFQSEHEARVIWLGVQNKKILNIFKEALDEKLVAEDFMPQSEDRQFSPHLTIGRLRNPHSVKDMISPFRRKSFGKIQVNEIILYDSKLQGVYPVYTPLHRSLLNPSLPVPGDEETFTNTP